MRREPGGPSPRTAPGRGIPTIDGPFFHPPSKQLLLDKAIAIRSASRPSAGLAAARRHKQWLAASQWTRGAERNGRLPRYARRFDPGDRVRQHLSLPRRSDHEGVIDQVPRDEAAADGRRRVPPMLERRSPRFSIRGAAADPKEPRIVVSAGNLIHLLAGRSRMALCCRSPSVHWAVRKRKARRSPSPAIWLLLVGKMERYLSCRLLIFRFGKSSSWRAIPSRGL